MSGLMSETRTEKRIFGDLAEQLTVEHLEREGYTIRDRNVLCRRGELDVVAEKGLVLAFVEVRMRSTAVWGDPSATVTHSKQRKVVLAAHEYCQRHRLFARVIRFDVVSVVGKGKTGQVEHIVDAFDAGL
jgi:putative endonuclease